MTWARTALWQQVTDAATPSNWPGMAWRTLPFDDLIAGWTCGDMERLGSGVVETGNLIIGTAGLVEAGQAWAARAGQTGTGWSRFNRPSGVAPAGNAGGVRLGGASAGSGGGKGASPWPNIYDGQRMSVEDALDAAEKFLGPGYRDMGKGRFVSADGTRQVRMGDSDILGKHGGGAHMNFEQLIPNSTNPGKMKVDRNIHIYLLPR